MLFNSIRALLMFTVAAVALVEIVGYFWHSRAQHRGWFGDTIRHRHRLHHEKDYPREALRPTHLQEYKSAGQWDWYLVAGVTVSGIFIILPLQDTLPLTLGAVFYAKYVVDYFHQTFHLPSHWLHQHKWFQKLMASHDIHHYAPCNYGIVFFWMDTLFGTYRPVLDAKTKEGGELFPNFKTSA